MSTLQRLFAGFSAVAIILQPAAALAAQLHFSNPVTVTADTTPADVLRQSDEYKDGVLTVDGHQYTVDEYGHALLKQPDKGWLCDWFGWWCPVLQTGEIKVTQADARARVEGNVISSIHAEMVKDTGRVLPILGFAYPEPLPAGTVVYQERKENAPMNVLHDSWFFFLDLDPQAMFDHRAQFVLVDATTGEITSKRVYSAPVIGGMVRYMDLTERWTTGDRFYPADLKDLPPGGDWPLKTNNLPAGDAPKDTPPSGMPQAAVPDELRDAVADGRLVPVAYAEAAPAPAAAADPCVGKERKKVAITIVGEGPSTVHHDGLVDGETMGNSEQNMVNMLGDMGVAQGDIHRFNPENTPKLEDVFKKIGEATKDLGPCDKVFLYVYGHGTITDEDNDDIPDSPSWGIAYGHGENAEYIGKNRWSKNSLIKLMEGMRAQDVNLIIESCFSGSIREWMSTDAANPAAGTNWHIFLAAGSLKPSYGHGAYDGKQAGAYYTDALTACASKKLAERGIASPTIEQIEDVMRECQKEFNDNPTHLINSPPTEEWQRTTYTVSPSVSIKEGDSGVTYAEFTITRQPPSDIPVSIEWSTYDPNAEDDDTSNYANPQDYAWNKKGSHVTFESGQATVTVRVAVYGDTVPEADEVFGVWFPSLRIGRTVTILDDDTPVTPPASSSAPSAAVSSATTITIDGGYVIPKGTTKDIGIGGLSGVGYTFVDGGDEGKTVVIKLEEPKEEQKPEIEVKCPTCEELAAQAQTQALICQWATWDLEDAQDKLADLDRQIASAQKDLKTAKDALNAFDHPKSSASSNGKTIDSSDLRAERRWSAGLWGQYRDGSLTAQQLEQRWHDGMTDAERADMKKQIHDELQQAVDDTQARLDGLNTDRAAAAEGIGKLKADLDSCNEELDRLIGEWMACEESCTEPSSEGVTESIASVSSSSSSTKAAESSAASSAHSSMMDGGTKATFTEPESQEVEVNPIDYRTGDEEKYRRSSKSSSKPAAVPSSSSKSSSSSSRPAVTPSSSSSKSSSSAPSVSQCPSGSTADLGECQDVCGSQGGTCKASNGCYTCEVAQCPSGTYTNTCPASCSSGCDVVGQDGGTTCYQCKKSCSEVCAGYSQVGTNWNSYIQSQLSQYSCVSAATVEVESTTIGSCTCSNQPAVQVDQTVPVCKGTPCGDVQCGGSASCQQGTTTVTVHCNWGGWKNVGENQFQPVLGSQ